jgi:hypothetical protein
VYVIVPRGVPKEKKPHTEAQRRKSENGRELLSVPAFLYLCGSV